MTESDNSDSAAGDQPGTASSLANQSNEQLMSNISFKMKDWECLSIATGLWGVWCKCHNLSIIPPPSISLGIIPLVSRVTPENIIRYFTSIIQQTLVRGQEDSSACRVLFTLYRAFSHDATSFVLVSTQNNNLAAMLVSSGS